MRCALLVSGDLSWAVQLATAWSRAGDTVTLVLLDGAAAAARRGHANARLLGEALGGGASVAVHDDALRRRGVVPATLVDGVKVLDLDEVADLVTDGADKAVWL